MSNEIPAILEPFNQEQLAADLENIALENAVLEAKVMVRQNALAKLAAIGLTQEEIDSL